jgi:hypothetical protein
MNPRQKGDLVELDGRLALVVGLQGDPNVPEGHLALWFGDVRGWQRSEGKTRGEVWTFPEEYCLAAGHDW